MTEEHRLEAFVGWLHGVLQNRGGNGTVGSEGDGRHTWMAYETRRGTYTASTWSRCWRMAAPKVLALRSEAGTRAAVAQGVAACLSEHEHE